jgi:hypothetical protein
VKGIPYLSGVQAFNNFRAACHSETAGGAVEESAFVSYFKQISQPKPGFEMTGLCSVLLGFTKTAQPHGGASYATQPTHCHSEATGGAVEESAFVSYDKLISAKTRLRND